MTLHFFHPVQSTVTLKEFAERNPYWGRLVRDACTELRNFKRYDYVAHVSKKNPNVVLMPSVLVARAHPETSEFIKSIPQGHVGIIIGSYSAALHFDPVQKPLKKDRARMDDIHAQIERVDAARNAQSEKKARALKPPRWTEF